MRTGLVISCVGLAALMIVEAVPARDFLERSARSAIPEAYFTADIGRGALLYDEWFTVTGAEPEGTHPAYPSTGARSGRETWRCKECHGWDYRGKDGNYGEGPHFTGISGVYGARTKHPDELYARLADAAALHDFSPYLGKDDLWAVVKFLREGLVDVGRVLGPGGVSQGSPERGKPLFEDMCVGCHGPDGNSIDPDPATTCVEGLGWLTNTSPEESLHKMRWGHPGGGMPSADAGGARLRLQGAGDILAYSQTLSIGDGCGAVPVRARSTKQKRTGTVTPEGELEEAEEERAAAFAAAAEEMSRRDAEAGRHLFAPALELGRREFLAYRAANCLLYGNGAVMSDNGEDPGRTCLVRMTRARTKELRGLVQEPDSRP